MYQIKVIFTLMPLLILLVESKIFKTFHQHHGIIVPKRHHHHHHETDEHLIATTPNGKFRGYDFKTKKGRTVTAFSGIAYAEPPVGDLRFKDPVPLKGKWSGIKDAFNYGCVCVQLTYLYPPVENLTMGNEDCLYLSVYTPKVHKNKTYPVLFYTHGGGFAEGSGETDRTPDYLMDFDIVVVMPNYRLGPLGFLSTEDKVLQGNMGMKDQSLALAWTHKNIINFGGDPGRITIAGESAGSASSSLHMYSPMSKDKIYRVISESGTANGLWSHFTCGAARQRAVRMAEIFNCPTNTSELIAKCLRNVNAYELTRAYKNFTVLPGLSQTVFVPVIDWYADKPFLPKNPYHENPVSVPWLTSVCSLEGLLYAGGFVRIPSSLTKYDKDFNTIVPYTLMFDSTASNATAVAEKMRAFYFGDKPLTLDLIANVTYMIGDCMFVWPMVHTLKKHLGPHWCYYNDYRGEYSVQEVLTGGQTVLKGATHTDELIYLWNNRNPLPIPEPTKEEDLKFSHDILNVWYNFISGSDPNDGLNFDWPQWKDDNRQYVTLSNTGIKNSNVFLKERVDFWSTLNFRDAEKC